MITPRRPTVRRATDLSLDELHLDLLVGVAAGQLAVELRLGDVLAAGGRRRDLLVLGQVEDGRREHLSAAGRPEGSQEEGSAGPHPHRSALGSGMTGRPAGSRSRRWADTRRPTPAAGDRTGRQDRGRRTDTRGDSGYISNTNGKPQRVNSISETNESLAMLL